MTNFHVGQKVCCVNAGWSDEFDWSPLVHGKIYIVTGMEDAFGFCYGDGIVRGLGLFIDGVVNPSDPSAPFFHARFRPVITRPTSIKIFTDMLETQRTGVRA